MRNQINVNLSTICEIPTNIKSISTLQVSNRYGWPTFKEYDFEKVDAHALQAPKQHAKSLTTLAKYLGGPFTSELEKARVAYTWITHNIKYDTDSLIKEVYPSTKPKNTLQRGIALCGGYAQLYKELVEKMGLQSKYLSGYSKPEPPGHAWNAVRIDGHWYLIDSTWGAGHVNDQQEFVQEFDDFNFLTPKIVFFYRHYPDDKSWLPDEWKNKNLTSGFEDWAKLLKPKSALINLGLFNQHFRRFEYFDNFTTTEAMTDLYIPKSKERLQRLDLTYNFHDAQNNEIPNAIMISDEKEDIRISVIFPAQGNYKLKLFGKLAKEEGSLPSLFSMKLDYSGAGSKEIYPTVYTLFHQHFIT